MRGSTRLSRQPFAYLLILGGLSQAAQRLGLLIACQPGARTKPVVGQRGSVHFSGKHLHLQQGLYEAR